MTTITDDIDTLIAGKLHDLITHGPDFLTREELNARLDFNVSKYYSLLAARLLHGRRDSKFWDYHKRKLKEAGLEFKSNSGLA